MKAFIIALFFSLLAFKPLALSDIIPTYSVIKVSGGKIERYDFNVYKPINKTRFFWLNTDRWTFRCKGQRKELKGTITVTNAPVFSPIVTTCR